MPQTYGYARVSTDGQTPDAQVAQLRAAGADRVFQEKGSGAKQERVQLRKLLDRLELEDVLLVTRLDRLARSTRDLLNILGTVAEKGASFRSLADTWARHHHSPWPAHAHRAGGLGRVRARAHPRPHG